MRPALQDYRRRLCVREPVDTNDHSPHGTIRTFDEVMPD